LEIDARELGTLDLDGAWVQYIDLHDYSFVPTRFTISEREYGFQSSMVILGHGAVLPGRIRELRESGKQAVVAERGNRYYVYVSPP